MRLPQIEYGAGVQDPNAGTSGVIQQTAGLGQAQRRAWGAVEEGLSALGEEMVKTQTQRAAADLTERLNGVEAMLRDSKVVSTAWVKEQLGEDFGSLDPEFQRELVHRVERKNRFRPDEVEIQEHDRDDIPTWKVAGLVYDRLSRQALEESSRGITGPWQASFRDGVAQHLAGRKARLNEEMTQAAHAQLGAEQSQTALKFARSGDYDAAREVLSSSRVLAPERRTQVEQAIGAIELSAKAEQLAMTIANAHTTAEGKVDGAAAIQDLDGLGEGELKDAVRGRLEHRVAMTDKGWQQNIASHYTTAAATYLQTGSLSRVDPEVKQWLISNAPDEWRKLQLWARYDGDYWRSRREGGGETPGQRRAWAELQQDMKGRETDYAAMPFEAFEKTVTERRLSPADEDKAFSEFARIKGVGSRLEGQAAQVDAYGEFLTWADEQGEALGQVTEERLITDWGHRLGKQYLNKALEHRRRAGTAGLMKESEFRATLRDEVAKLFPKKGDKRNRNAAITHMTTWYRRFLEENNGRPPTRKEALDKLADGFTYGDLDQSIVGRNRYRFQLEPGQTVSPHAQEDQKSELARQRMEAGADLEIEEAMRGKKEQPAAKPPEPPKPPPEPRPAALAETPSDVPAAAYKAIQNELARANDGEADDAAIVAEHNRREQAREAAERQQVEQFKSEQAAKQAKSTADIPPQALEYLVQSFSKVHQAAPTEAVLVAQYNRLRAQGYFQ